MLFRKQRCYLHVKRMLDLLGSALALILLSPLFFFCTIVTAVVSKGNPFFLQKRIGQDEDPFRIIKFRSMQKDAKQIAPCDLTESEQNKMLTSWGIIMRKLGLDELPQLINIFVGQMSFLGPRPSQAEAVEENLIVERRSFLPSPYCVKPGLSGFSQVVACCGHDYRKKAANDSLYVKHLSFSLDCFIFWKTILWFFGFRKR